MSQWDELPAEAIAITVDRHGLQAWFDGPCRYHGRAGKWIALGKSKRHEIGLVQISPDFQAGGAIEVRPGKEEEFGQAVAKFPEFPGVHFSSTPVPGAGVTQFNRLTEIATPIV